MQSVFPFNLTLTIGDLVSVALPRAADGPAPAVGLVFDLRIIGCRHFIEIAPIAAGIGIDRFVLRDCSRLAPSLQGATFDCGHRILLAPESRRFVRVPQTDQDIVGRLAPSDLDRLHHLRAKAWALRDIAASRRAAARQTPDLLVPTLPRLTAALAAGLGRRLSA